MPFQTIAVFRLGHALGENLVRERAHGAEPRVDVGERLGQRRHRQIRRQEQKRGKQAEATKILHDPPSGQ
ncbi:hypothetical protein LB553_02120 [Mesorhizobium sp. CA8]|uniref:hypothetical protein n=1 Tax=unclassified Mesorhizobium TaxID=325217 RepID=UPI001CCCC7F7|nr:MULTISPECIES: hypothetical protein [unclassified Mesorhizobium]MBZ9759681.1 hypothetical protein [Mesorhizobium sp. CA8]MBZ9822118.1 hypothetical protein [Mesorhizobium sp. CA4]